MLTKYKRAYYVGWRAGKSEPQFLKFEDGYKRLVTPRNPYPRFSLSAFLWEEGRYNGQYERLKAWRPA